MSGLFGANAVRSPLSDVPSSKARTAEQLEGIIENALLPDTFETARLTLQAMRPITNDQGFMAEVRTDRLDPQSAEKVLGVLNAGTTIHAVEFDHEEDRYLVRAELFEFLSGVSKKAFQSNAHHATIAEMEKTVSVALLPDIAGNIDIVLAHLHPITEKHGFMAEIRLGEVDAEHKRVVRHLLNAGAVHQRVQRSDPDGSHYFIHRDLYQAMARLRARAIYRAPSHRIGGRGNDPGDYFGGSLNATPTAIAHHPADPPVRQVAVPPPVPNQGDADRTSIRQRFMMGMGYAPSAYRDLVNSGALPQANALALHVRRLCQQNRGIAAQIDTELSDRRIDLEGVAAGLRHEAYNAKLVDEMLEEMTSILPALLLTQGGPYQEILGKLIEHLESQDAEGALDGRELQFLNRLRYHESALSKIARNDPADWQRVVHLIEDFADGETRSDQSPDGDRQRPN